MQVPRAGIVWAEEGGGGGGGGGGGMRVASLHTRVCRKRHAGVALRTEVEVGQQVLEWFIYLIWRPIHCSF